VACRVHDACLSEVSFPREHSIPGPMNKLHRICIAFSLTAAVAACGTSGDDKPATQVAAKVNSDEISVHQVNNVVARSGASSAEQAKVVGSQVLERLIDQQLMIQKAIENKLDRDAAVVTAIENSRRQILSQAYIERAVANAPKPSTEEIGKYYSEHPQLFSQRRVYRFQEFLAAVNPEQLKALQALLDKSKNLNAVANWMREQSIPFSGNFSIRAAEQLPMEQLPRFQAMKPGEIAVFPAPNRVLVTQLVAVQEAPLSEKEATPVIERFLVNQRRAELSSAELKKLRDAAKVEYVGAFAENRSAASQGSPPPPSGADAAGKDDAGAIEKGLTGLK